MEYRLVWSASTNISFRGSTDWQEVDDPDMTNDEFEDMLCKGEGTICEGLSMVLEESGFEWWVETR